MADARQKIVRAARGVMDMRTAMVGARAPDFSLHCTEGPGLDRGRVTLDDYLDRWLMLLFYTRDFTLI
jgi:peroxiredoxin